jgi:hypothetical protein
MRMTSMTIMTTRIATMWANARRRFTRFREKLESKRARKLNRFVRAAEVLLKVLLIATNGDQWKFRTSCYLCFGS